MTELATDILLVVACFASVGWSGEVMVLNLAVIPSLKCLTDSEKARLLSALFPRFFRLATFFATSTVTTGSIAAIMNWTEIPSPALVGGGMIVLLAVFHVVVESRLRPVVRSFTDTPDPRKIHAMMRFLRIVPRIGIVVIVTGLLLIAFSLCRFTNRG